MIRGIGPAELLVLGLLVGVVHCKPGQEKSAETTPSTQDTAQDSSRGLDSTETRVTSESLENTYWKLTRLGDAPIAEAPREPHFILDPATRRVGGSGGCNLMTGSYELNGDRLSFDSMSTTLMACADGMETEKSFLDALLRVTRWNIAGQELELLDKSGHTIARFEARQPE
jgi:heat shock protein HslJ